MTLGTSRASSAWRELLLPGASSLAAAVSFGFALAATSPAVRDEPPATTPERAAEEFVHAYQAGDFAAAARLATGSLRRSLEQRARSARLQGVRRDAVPRRLVIEESFVVDQSRLRLAGLLVRQGEVEVRGQPVSITLVRDGSRYLAEVLHWPQGAPAEAR